MLVYGSNFKPVPLSTEEVGHKFISRKSGWIGLLRIIATIAEIGIAFTGIGAVAETGAGLAFGGFNQFLDKESGSTSAAGTFLNFGAPLIGGAFVARSNLKQVGRGIKNIESTIAKFDLIADRTLAKETGLNVFRGFKSTNKELETLKSLDTFGRFNKGIPKDLKAVISKGRNLKLVSGLDIGRKISSKGTDNLAREVFEDENYYRSLGFTKSEIKKITDILEVSLKQVDATRGLEKLGELLGNIKRTTQSSGVRSFIKDFEKGVKAIKKAGFEIDEASIIYRSFKDTNKKYGYKFARELQLQAEPSFIKRTVKRVGTARFNDRVVQRAQLVDPNDMGRAPIEWLYQKLKKKIAKYFGHLQDIDDGFTKSGGINLNSSWVRGYKLITSTPYEKLIMIAFRPEVTNNKRPVLVWANRFQMKELMTKSPGKTYQKYWALSKGGKAIGISSLFGGIHLGKKSMIVDSVLAFIPVQALKNILSIISNYVENAADMANGSYTKNWVKKFTGSLERSAISRTFRLGGKVIAGGYVGRAFGKEIGRFIGAELQRVGTQVAAVAIKNAIAGKPVGAGIVRNIKRGVLVSIRSNTLRKTRAKRGRSSVIINTLSARRKLQQVKRIPNAVVPGRPFKGIKI